MTALLYFAGETQEVWFAWSALDRVIRLALLIVGGAAVYAATLLLLGLRPRHLLRAGAG